MKTVTLSLTSAREIAGMLAEAAKVIEALPEDLANQLRVRHFLPDELVGGACIVVDAIKEATK